jgi:hypothetical protein
MEMCVGCKVPFNFETGHFSVLTPCGIHLGVCSQECWWHLHALCFKAGKTGTCRNKFEIENNQATCSIIGYPSDGTSSKE